MMQRLHPVADHEVPAARGEYVYTRGGEGIGFESWEHTRCYDGSTVWRAERSGETGRLLSHTLVNPEGRHDRIQMRLYPPLESPSREAVYTFFDDTVMLVQQGRRQSLDLPPDYTIMGVDVASRGLALAGLDLTTDNRALQLIFTVQLRGDAFWSKPVKWAVLPAAEIETLAVGAIVHEVRRIRLAVPGLPDQHLWLDQYGIPVRWRSGEDDDGWEAYLTSYVRWKRPEPRG